MKNKIIQFIIALLICHAPGIIGSLFTAGSIDTWYATLNRPSISPPNWIFAPVWLTLYTLMGISLFLIWQKGLKKKEVKAASRLFIIHLIFNGTWSIIFFGLHMPGLAFANIIIIWLFIIALIVKFWKLSRTASILLWPYFLWVSFASVLNYQIWMLN